MIERTLHRDYYFSPEIFQQEKERIFCREWVGAGREEELPARAITWSLEVAGESLIVVRTREGELAAHYNVCRHRGSPPGPRGLQGSPSPAQFAVPITPGPTVWPASFVPPPSWMRKTG